MTERRQSQDHGDAGDAVAQPRLRVIVIDDYCTHKAGSDCDRCTHCCPHGAIALEDGSAPSINPQLCTGCGICYGVCDSFSPTRISIDELHARIRRSASLGDRVYLTCNENVFPGLTVDSNVVVLPCLSMVSPELWTLLLAEDIRLTIACDLRYCEDCTRAAPLGGDLFGRAIEIAEQRTEGKVLYSPRIPEANTLVGKYMQSEEGIGRRSAFTGFASDIGQIATGKRRLRNSEVLQDYYVKREKQRAISKLNLSDSTVFDELAPKGRIRRVLFPKRRMTLEAIDVKPSIAPRIDVALSKTDATLCAQCLECVAHCPTGARRPRKSGPASVDVRLCIGCGICVDACPNAACSVYATTGEVLRDALDTAAE